MEINCKKSELEVSEKKFFLLWVYLLSPFLNLTKKEEFLTAALLQKRYNLSKGVKDENILNEILFSTATRKQIRKELNWEDYSFNTTLSFLRNKSIIIDNKINEAIIPKIDDKNFKEFTIQYFIKIKN